MKNLLFLFAFVFFVGVHAKAGTFTIDDFAIKLEQITSSPEHIWVNSGYTTVNPQNNTVMGVNEFYSPPFAAKKFNLAIEIVADTIHIPDVGSYGKGDVGLLYSGGLWYPHKIVRRGTFHHLKNDQLISLGAVSELAPLYGRSGFLLKIMIKNRASRSVHLNLRPKLTPGTPSFVPLDKWGYGPPRLTNMEPEQTSEFIWKNDKTILALYQNNTRTELFPNETMVSYFIVLMDAVDTPLPKDVNAQQLASTAASAWENRLAKYTKNIPTLESDIDGLKSFYYRSLVSGLVCIWENNTFAVNPHLATGGMDGGLLCSYLWDSAGYVPYMSTLMLDSAMIDIAKKMTSIDLEKYYAFTPDGQGVGVKYSYSPCTFTDLVCAIFKILGPDESLFMSARNLLLNDEKNQPQLNHVIDYGLQHNLLEMRGAGWEHFVVSPNAERVWCFRQLAEMGRNVRYDPEELTEWKKQAEIIKRSIQQELWDNKVQWFISRYPNGYTDHVYSIQAYEAIRAGVCDSSMTAALVSHLCQGAFLGEYGISSVSAEDTVHYEILDTDWSGGGAYTGDGPQLSLIMYEIDKSAIAWDILKRHFWMGKHLIYYPQEHYNEKPMSPAHKRANNVSGLAGAETILFGLIGFQPQYNGQLWIHPHPAPEGFIKIQGFRFKESSFDIELTKTHLRVNKDHHPVYEGIPKKMRIL